MARVAGGRLSLVVVLASISSLALADGLTERARRLADLRAEVEGLAEQVDLEREALRAELRSVERETAELEARVRQEEARLAETERLLADRRAAVEGGGVAREALQPVLVEALDGLEVRVRAGLPYHVVDRLAAIDELRAQVEGGDADLRRAAGRVWQLAEDELRLARENVLDRQVVPLDDGTEVLADVARVGLVALYWRATDGRAGRAVRDGDRWRFVALHGDDAVKVDELFEALRKQVRVGWFELPGLLADVEVPR